MKFSAIILFHTTVLSSLFGANGFVNHQSIAFQSNVHNVKDQSTVLLEMAKKVGIFFGTSTGSTEGAAYAIQEAFSDDDVSEPIEIDSLEGKVAATFQEYDSLIVGTPTWNTGADTERSGTGWDELYYGEMQDLNIQGKNVAVFGLGDSVSYSENYADGSGELHDVFETLGCKLFGYTSQNGYEHEASKAIRGDKFCGLMLDAVNQEELTEERVANWVTQLKSEGFLDGGSSFASSNTVTPTISVENTSANDALKQLEDENARLRQMLEDKSKLLEESLLTSTSTESDGYTPHYNPKTGSTMWTSPDGKTCYYTSVDPKISAFKP